MATFNINVTGIQPDIQFQDEGVNEGAPGAVTTVDFIGTGVTASEAAGTLTVTVPGGGTGDVVGAPSSTDNQVVLFDGATGKLIKETSIIFDDGAAVTILGDLFIDSGTGQSTFSFGQNNSVQDDNCAVFGRNGTIIGSGGASENSILFGLNGTIDNAQNAVLFALTGALETVNTTGTFNVFANEVVFSTANFKLPLLADGLLLNTSGLVQELPLGTGVQTALGINVGLAGAPVVNGGALGTPSSGVGTNLTGTATGLSIGGNAATVTTNANLTGPVTSTGNATAIADGALSIAKTSGLQTAIDAKVADAINDGTTTIAPSQNAVFDALALKQPLDADLTAIAGLASAANKTIQFTGSGTAALVDLQNGVEAAYSGTPTFTAGAAPSGASSLRQLYQRIGNSVTWQISLTYANAGTTVTNLSLTFPSEFPTPAIPTGFTGASAWLWNMNAARFISTPSGTIAAFGLYMIRRNAADTGFNIESGAAVTSGTYRTFIFSGTYFTA